MSDVSVVIPTHNRRQLLLRALASVRAQESVRVEVIVIDDGSSDDTCAAVEALGDARIRCLRSEESQGVSSARNRGIHASGADWIAFLDDDDLWAPAKLERQLIAATNLGRSWACSGSVTVDDELRVIAGSAPETAEDISAALPFRNAVPAGASNVLVSRDLLGQAGDFDLRLRHMADWDLWIRLLQHGLPAVIPEPDVAYVLHDANASSDSERIEHELQIIEERYSAARAGRRIDRAFALRWVAWNLLRAGRRGAAARTYGKAVLSGDAASAARAAVALLDPGIVGRTLERGLDPVFAGAADAWLASYR